LVHIAKYMLPLVLSCVAAAAQAQFLGPSWESNVSLTREDLDMIRSAVTLQIHNKPIGTTAAWTNPQSGNSGSLRLLRISSRQSRHCEDIEYLIRPPGKPAERVVFTSCLQPDGNWRLSD
jgi:surface antigen